MGATPRRRAHRSRLHTRIHPGGTLKRWWIIAGIAVVVSTIAAVFGLRTLTGPQTAPTQSPSPAVTGTAALAPAEADRIASDLQSKDRKRILRSLTIPAGTKVDNRLLTGLSALGKMTIRVDSAVSLDEHSVRVYADVQKGTVKTWTLLLTDIDGTWRVSATLEGEQK